MAKSDLDLTVINKTYNNYKLVMDKENLSSGEDI